MNAERPIVVQARPGEGACPYCREALAPGERVLVCEGCGASYHAACMRQELGRCATLGCAGTRALPREVAAVIAAPPAVPPAAVQVKVTPRADAGALGRRGLACAVALQAAVGAALLGGGAYASDPELLLAGGALLAVAAAAFLGVWLLGSAPSGFACARCRTTLARGERVLQCEGCADRYHPACLRTVGRCQRAGCPGARARPARA